MAKKFIVIMQVFDWWKQLFFAAGVAALVGYFGYKLTAQQWEAVVAIQVGQVGQVGQVAQQSIMMSGQSIEALPIVIERLGSPYFATSVAERIKRPQIAQSLMSKKYDGGGKIEARQTSGTDLIVIRVQEHSPELAKVLAEAIADQLIEDHAKLNAQLWAASQDVAVGTIKQISKNNATLELVGLLQTVTEPNLRSTKKIWPVSTSPSPVWPKPLYFVGLTAVVFLLIGSALIYLKERKSMLKTIVS
jgi:uncharacterized protein involved in exopolysaccharide biosynthesis